jgi:hypothetical protein
MKTNTPRTTRRYAIEIDRGDGDFMEVAASKGEASASALAWLWQKHDTSMNLRVRDLRSDVVIMPTEEIRSM